MTTIRFIQSLSTQYFVSFVILCYVREQDHAQTIQEIQQRHEENITRMKGHLKAKEDEVESLKRR